MIAVDMSAIVAIALKEPERDDFRRIIKSTTRAYISPVSILEAKMVLHGRRGQRAVVLIDDLLRLPVFEMTPPALLI
jgi:ribonuclease VapC